MKKLLLTMMTVLLTWVAVMAVPAKPGLKKVVTQSDGTTITLSLMGDEWHHSWVTSDGKPTVKAANGDMVYRTADGPSTVVAHEKAQRGAEDVPTRRVVPDRARRRATPRFPKRVSPKFPLFLCSTPT